MNFDSVIRHIDYANIYSWKHNPKRKLSCYKTAVKTLVFEIRHSIKRMIIRLRCFTERHQWKLVLALVLGHIYEGIALFLTL